jgi:sulfite reductase (ferredoxin)
MGAVLPRPDGTKSEAFLVHLGGRVGESSGLGRKVKGVRIFAEDAADYVELLLRRYLHRRDGHDGFGPFLDSLSAEELARFAAPEVRA